MHQSTTTPVASHTSTSTSRSSTVTARQAARVRRQEEDDLHHKWTETEIEINELMIELIKLKIRKLRREMDVED